MIKLMKTLNKFNLQVGMLNIPIKIYSATETKDNVKVRIKPIVLTKTLGPHSILTLLRSMIREFIIAHFKKFTFDELIHQLINIEIQRALKDNLKKIYPISVVEVRYLRKL